MTLKDIADLAGVSTMTVSNVINGKTSRVSQKTREKINSIIKEYNYVPNLNARSLSNKTSHIIGIIIFLEDNEYDSGYNSFENPYISTMIGTIERELQKNGYFAMLQSVSRNSDIISLLKNWNVDGIILLFPTSISTLKKLIENTPCPIATFDSDYSHPNLINVLSDDEKGLYLSTKYMINHGHTSIAFVADYEGNSLLTRRFNGYKRALEESNIPFNPNFIFRYSPSYEGGIEAGRTIAGDKIPVTAAVTTADICAIGIMEGARLGGYRIPIDLSVIGYDNLTLCQYTVPKLTSVSQNVPEKAKLATNLLLKKIQGNPDSDLNSPVLDVEIVDRQSVISLY
ncbi:LacI family DNA-binding transcriptional regulator [Agathobacter sp.]